VAIEIEKKYRLNGTQFAAIRDLLGEFQANYAGEDFEENTIYGGASLDERRAILRIRRTDSKTFLTFKERIHNDFGVKHQTEHETEVADAGELSRIIEALGFEPRIVYEKRRRTWKFRSVEVVLDELPFGLFMEIEGSVTGIAEAEMLLEAEDFEAVSESYPALTWNLGKRVGERAEARFAKPQ
jgi:adenylate cyclase class 2